MYNTYDLPASEILQSGTFNSQPVKADKELLASLHYSKTGTGKGTGKLQGSNDGATWVDLPGATASAAIGAGAATGSLYSTTNPFVMIRLNFVEDGTGAMTITGGKFAVK